MKQHNNLHVSSRQPNTIRISARALAGYTSRALHTHLFTCWILFVPLDFQVPLMIEVIFRPMSDCRKLIARKPLSNSCPLVQLGSPAASTMANPLFNSCVFSPTDLTCQWPLWVISGHFAVQSPCPLWVKSRHLQCKRACPLYPRKRTCAAQPAMSAMG